MIVDEFYIRPNPTQGKEDIVHMIVIAGLQESWGPAYIGRAVRTDSQIRVPSVWLRKA